MSVGMILVLLNFDGVTCKSIGMNIDNFRLASDDLYNILTKLKIT